MIPGTPRQHLDSDPERLRRLADWCDAVSNPAMAAAARQAALNMEAFSSETPRGAPPANTGSTSGR